MNNMHLMDEQMVQDRREVVQDVIDLTQANGKGYLNALKEFNKNFKKNPNNQILNEKHYLQHEQRVAIRA